MSRRRAVNSPYTKTTPFGQVPGYPLNNGFHTGVDYVTADKLIVAPMDSVVSATGYDATNGNYLVLDSGGYRDWFAHIKTNGYLVSVGQTVSKGQQLAYMGMTGAADGVHLHHSVRVNGVLTDPEQLIKEGGNDMTEAQAAELSLYIRLLAFESVEEANSHSADDVSHMLADPGYAGAIAKAVYQGEWQLPAYKAGHYDADTKAQYDKGYSEGQADGGGEFVKAEVYVKK